MVQSPPPSARPLDPATPMGGRNRGIVASLLAAVLVALLLLTPMAGRAESGDAGPAPGSGEVQMIWRLLDYIAVDYAGAVADGRVVSPTEYAEQREFAGTVATKLAALPPRPGRAALMSDAARLRSAIGARAAPDRIAAQAHGLAAALLAAYPVPLAPATPPSLARGAALFARNCASCHGAAGDGRGPDAAQLPVPPVAFTDATRARQRSVFALYQVVTQGLDGTPMRAFDELSADDRWALAFYSGQFAFAGRANEGKQLWRSDPAIRALVPDLEAMAALTPDALAARIGQRRADAVLGYLRQDPAAVADTARVGGSLALVRERMAASLAASRAGDRARAGALALSAYLDGFEPVEPTLRARASELMTNIEGRMIAYRAAVKSEDTDRLATRQAELAGLFDAAETALSPGAASAASAFVGAAAILLREGLEALLIVVAMLAFLRKAERPEAVRYVHGGWIAALLAGVLTWVIATWAIGMSGASRELTEGIGSLVAALVLLSVGIWMHGKAQADQWQRYIRERMAAALTGRSAWFLFGLAFVVVYREAFETILFYVALSAQGNGAAMLGGAASAALLLALIAWALLRYSRKLPIGTFFRYSSWLMAVLTVVLAGKGVAALQEAGWIDIAPAAAVPRIDLLGVFPNAQSLGAQAAMAVLLAAGFWWNGRRARPA